MNKKFKVVFIVSTVLLFVLVALGVWLKIYQNSLNDQRAESRIAAVELDEVAIGYDNNLAGFYPNMIYDLVSYEYNSHFYETLTELNEVFQIKGQLAESWENPSDNVWRFYLKKNVKFHDGSIMTAKDVKASIEMAMADENFSVLVPSIASVFIVNDYVIDINTSLPSPLLANNLTALYILPEKIITAKTFDQPIGTGPFMYLNQDGNVLTLKRFDSYHGEKPMVEMVLLKSYIDSEERVAALKGREVDVIPTMYDSSDLGKDKNDRIIKTITLPSLGVAYLSLDAVTDVSPYITGVSKNPFKDIRVRQAFQYALDINKLIESAKIKNTDPASQTVAPTIFGYDPIIKTSVQNIPKAKMLMAEAGYQNGFTITLDMAQSEYFRKDLAYTLKEQLAEIGINLKVNLLSDGNVFFEKILSGDTALFYIQYDCSTGDALEAFQMMYGEQLFYKNSYSTSEMLSLTTETEGVFDSAKRKSNLQQLSRLADQAKTQIPLFEFKQSLAHLDSIEVIARYDGMILAKNISGSVPEEIQGDYSYLDVLKKVLGFDS